MCGRFEFKVNLNNLDWIFRKHAGILHIDYDRSLPLKEKNIAPTDMIRVAVLEGGDYKLKVMKWAISSRVYDRTKPADLFGEFPFIVKDLFNSRIETLSGSSFWKPLLFGNRCLVPMTAFYEWVRANGKKEPKRIFLKNDGIFFAAGIYSTSDIKGETGASIITCNPNRFMRPVHNRMPVLFEPENAVRFLNASDDEVTGLCIPLDDSISMEMEKAAI